MNIPNPSIETLVCGGTLGDMFIVLCKLYTQYETKGKHFRLIRYSLWPEMDSMIKKLFKITSFIEYSAPCQSLNNLEQLYKAFRNSPYKIINSQWKKDELETYSINYENLNPYPVLQTPQVNVPHNHMNVGVQLHCGTKGHNFRGFSLKWLAKLRKILPINEFDVYLFGTGQNFCMKKIRELCEKYTIKNLVDQTDFGEWMSYIKAMDVFISLEGFAALFAMSQKIPTVEYYQYSNKIDDGSVNPAWEKNNVIFNITPNRVLRKIRYWRCKYLGFKNLYSPRNLYLVKGFICNNTSNLTNK